MLASCWRVKSIYAGLPGLLGSGGLKTGRYFSSRAYALAGRRGAEDGQVAWSRGRLNEAATSVTRPAALKIPQQTIKLAAGTGYDAVISMALGEAAGPRQFTMSFRVLHADTVPVHRLPMHRLHSHCSMPAGSAYVRQAECWPHQGVSGRKAQLA